MLGVACLVLGLMAGGAEAQESAAETLAQQGDELMESGQAKRAVAAYKGAIAVDPDYMPPYGSLATYLLRQRQYKQAAQILGKALSRNKDYAEGWYSLAYALRKMGRLDRAIRSYHRYIKLVPGSPDAYFGLGLAMKQKKDYAGALENFQRYIELERRPERAPWVEKAKVTVAELERITGRKARPEPAAPLLPAEQVRDEEEAVLPGAGAGTRPPADGLTPRQRRARTLKEEGDRLIREGQFRKAVTQYRAALAADPTYEDAYNELGTALFGLQRYDEAVRVFAGAVRTNPNYHKGYYNLAYALRKAKRYRQAVTAYNRYIGFRPRDPDPYFGLALALKAQRKKRQAVQAFKRYIKYEKRESQKRWVEKARAEVLAMGGKLGPEPEDTGVDQSEAARRAARKARIKAEAEARRQRQEDLRRMAAAAKDQAREAARRRARLRKLKEKLSQHLRKWQYPDLTPATARMMGPPKPAGPGGVPLADKLAREGKCEMALPMYQQALKNQPTSMPILDGLAYCAFETEQYEVGIMALSRAQRLDRELHKTWLHLARLQMAARKYVRAVGAYRKYLRRRPGHKAVYLEMARGYREAKVKGQALLAYKEYLEREQRPEALPRRIAAYLEMKELGGSAPRLEIPLGGRRPPHSISVEKYLQLRAERKVIQDEIASLEAQELKAGGVAVKPRPARPAPGKPERAPKSKVALSSLGLALLGDIPQASPALPPAGARPKMIALGDRAYSNGARLLALGFYHQAALAAPGDPAPAFKAGVTALAVKQPRLAVKYLEQVTRMDPRHKLAARKLKLARARIKGEPPAIDKELAAARKDNQRGNYPLAEMRMDELLQAGLNPELLLVRARARLGQRKVQQALQDAAVALLLEPSRAAALALMGEGHRMLKHNDKALYYFRAYMDRAPDKAPRRQQVQKAIDELSR
jgi:tetratricopeptide (TPR) repeat protein